MARNSMTSEINNGNRSSNRPDEQVSLKQLEEKHKQQILENLNKIAQDNIKKQADLELKLKQAGISESSAEYKRRVALIEKELEKNRQAQKVKDLNEYYKLEQELIDENLKIEKEARERILQSDAASYKEKLDAIKDSLSANVGDILSKAVNSSISNTVNQLNAVVNKYIDFQKGVNARLQGSGRTFNSAETMLTTAIGIQPYVKTEDMVKKLSDLVDTGVAYNVELRAFLGTVSENIASTFEVANGTLLRLVRLQQEDSTAARLGLEASLTRYFNGMYQNTEYLNQTFDNVSQSLIEASSTMNRDQAIQFEYQVQKWLGSLYSVGMSDTTVEGLAQALGYLGSGNINALNNSQYQQLLVMAASRAGMNYSDLLINGMDSGSTNVLLKSMTQYLQEIAQGTNQVVKSELAQVFGVSMSDLTAALNLNTDAINNISSKSMNWGSSMAELSLQLSLLPTRINTSVMIDTLWDNIMYGYGSNVAKNPLLSAIWKVTDLIQNTTGGINIPTVSVIGNYVDLNTTVENLMKLGIVGIGSLGMIGDLISGLSSTALPLTMLWKLEGLSQVANAVTLGGRGLSVATSGLSTSSTTYVGNSSGSDIAQAATQQASDEAQVTADAQTSEKDLTEMTDLIQQDVNRLYELFDSIITTDGLRVTELIRP